MYTCENALCQLSCKNRPFRGLQLRPECLSSTFLQNMRLISSFLAEHEARATNCQTRGAGSEGTPNRLLSRPGVAARGSFRTWGAGSLLPAARCRLGPRRELWCTMAWASPRDCPSPSRAPRRNCLLSRLGVTARGGDCLKTTHEGPQC